MLVAVVGLCDARVVSGLLSEPRVDNHWCYGRCRHNGGRPPAGHLALPRLPSELTSELHLSARVQASATAELVARCWHPRHFWAGQNLETIHLC